MSDGPITIPVNTALRIQRAESPLTGSLRVPSDKSITHRALLFGALNNGRTTIRTPSSAADARSTLDVLGTLGFVVREEEETWHLAGGMPRSAGDELTLDCGNSGTTARLAAGFLTGERGRFTLTGDASLGRRPMERVAEPLRAMGAAIGTTEGRLPMIIESRHLPIPGSLELFETESAQVHGALVLAGLRSERGVLLRRMKPMRDHTLRMAHAFGASIATTDAAGWPIDEIAPSRIDCNVIVTVPGDISSAAFIVVAALIVPGSHVRIEGVGLNPTRTAMLECLRRMGARIEWRVERDDGEPAGTIEAEYSPSMTAIQLDGSARGDVRVAEMMDELPLLALVATQAEGITVVRGAGELRVKESDRISVTARMFAALGMEMEELEDGFRVRGRQHVPGGTAFDHAGDHRIAMVGALAGLIAEQPVTINDPEVVSVSYPQFWSDMRQLGAAFL